MLYQRVVPLTRDGRKLAIDGSGEPVEWLLEMARFPDDALYSRIADARPARCRDRATSWLPMIVEFHRAAEPRPDKGGFAGHAQGGRRQCGGPGAAGRQRARP